LLFFSYIYIFKSLQIYNNIVYYPFILLLWFCDGLKSSSFGFIAMASFWEGKNQMCLIGVGLALQVTKEYNDLPFIVVYKRKLPLISYI